MMPMTPGTVDSIASAFSSPKLIDLDWRVGGLSWGFVAE
jgi:hypothetical protein